tara:strand:- start:56549 stop:57001 length:453 start_codon:yes stop_codon:yes gene_type:complete
MKLFTIALLALNFAFAHTFNFSLDSSVVSTRTSGEYQLISDFSVEVIQTLKKSAIVSINGEADEYTARVSSRINDLGEKETTYTIILKSDVLADMVCDEREEVNYELSFTQLSAAHFSIIRTIKMEANLMYTYDWCHSSADYTTITYQLN